ncbi:MoaD/ThiS family protein [Arenibacter sp. GZD96]|uniref:MoaD/ThiS family protein n=1 Tax=Aurantibrevibacter litoralis TaxID=3106030 RepID=UPI002AFF0357|nr:MoaD/ThiS family protein [Arenibacter sp. GZD-96]MEA1785342.1 MoaD/ThiS family protein [Arenibacter sp. GZD-96]
MTVLLFGITKDIVGSSALTIPKDSVFAQGGKKTVGDLKRYLGEKYPQLLQLSSLAIAVNSAYATDDKKIDTFDEIALIPPVSGG